MVAGAVADFDGMERNAGVGFRSVIRTAVHRRCGSGQRDRGNSTRRVHECLAASDLAGYLLLNAPKKLRSSDARSSTDTCSIGCGVSASTAIDPAGIFFATRARALRNRAGER